MLQCCFCSFARTWIAGNTVEKKTENGETCVRGCYRS